MIRNLTIVAVASFVLCAGCFAGAFAIGGRDLIQHGWTIPSDWHVDVSDDGDAVHVGPGHVRVEDGETTTRQVTWTGGDALQIDVPAQVTFTQAAPGAGGFVKITGPKRLVDRVVVENGRLSLRDESGAQNLVINGHGIHVSDDEQLAVEITAPSVRTFTVNGSGDLYLKAYDQPSLALEVNGSGNVEAEGKAGKLDLQISGSGEADLQALQTKDARIALSGSGEAHAAPTGATAIELAGSGDVYLTSKPSALTTNIAGSGEVHQDW